MEMLQSLRYEALRGGEGSSLNRKEGMIFLQAKKLNYTFESSSQIVFPSTILNVLGREAYYIIVFKNWGNN